MSEDKVSKPIVFEAVQQKHLVGMLGLLYNKAQDEKIRMAWAVLGRKVQGNNEEYWPAEIHLLTKAVEASITAGQNLVARTPEDQVEVRLKAAAVDAVFKSIKEKLNG